MTLTHEVALGAITSYMETRCAVSSQHKLPTMDDILSSRTARIIGTDRTQELVWELVGLGVLIRYGPYFSDHDVEVL